MLICLLVLVISIVNGFDFQKYSVEYLSGMLLELDSDVIRSLILSPSDLKRAVDKSLASLRADGSQRQEYGEELYGILAGRYDAESAAKITGIEAK